MINVSHELRTPLASIQGYTETLLDGAGRSDHNLRLGIIRHNAERLARLTEDLLTLSRVEQKRQKFEFDIHLATPDSRRLRTGGADRPQELYRAGGRARSGGCGGLLR